MLDMSRFLLAYRERYGVTVVEAEILPRVYSPAGEVDFSFVCR